MVRQFTRYMARQIFETGTALLFMFGGAWLLVKAIEHAAPYFNR